MKQVGTPEERVRLYAGLGRVHEATREWGEAQNAYERMLAEARESDDRKAEWEARLRLAALGVEGSVRRPEEEDELHGRVRRKRDDSDEEGGSGQEMENAAFGNSSWSLSVALANAEEALSLAREMRRKDLVMQSLAALGALEAHAGRWERVLSVSEEGLSVYAGMGDRAMEGDFLHLYAYGLFMMGEHGEAIRRMRDHPGLTGEIGDRDIYRASAHGIALALIEAGDYEEALEMAREGLAAARSMDYTPRLMFNLLAFGDALRALFRLEEAGEVYREMAGMIFPLVYRAMAHSKLCAVAALAGDWEAAHSEAILAVRIRDEMSTQNTESLHRYLEVEALLRGGSEDLAREQLERFGEAVGENRRLRLAYLRALAILRRWEGDGAATLTHLREARGLAVELSLSGEMWQIEASLGELHGELGDVAEARRSYSQAATVVRKLADGIRDRELRRWFLSALQVRRALEEV